jgi:aarF domain-containing kinase
VDTYLKMLLEDNFVHTDLHPGNILVRPVGGGTMHHAGDPDPAAAGAAAAAAGAGLAAVAEEAGVEVVAPVRERHQPQPLQLVLLDFGLAEELTLSVRFHFISFLHYIAKGG